MKNSSQEELNHYNNIMVFLNRAQSKDLIEANHLVNCAVFVNQKIEELQQPAVKEKEKPKKE